jgi:uncharacterized Fe-S cluster-containing MiaB family protein
MVCEHVNRVCNICVYFNDVRLLSSYQKYVQKQSLAKVILHAVRRIEYPKGERFKIFKTYSLSLKIRTAFLNATFSINSGER